MALELTLAFGLVVVVSVVDASGELAETNDLVGETGREGGRVLFREEGLEVAGDTVE